MLCRKNKEELSWQEIAETEVFKGRRKHRSLSQRKHTISKMGPKFQEPEAPWTPEEEEKLCRLGDSGKTLGDIFRKFKSRNAERCMNRYFEIRGHPTGRSRTNTSSQARHGLALNPLGNKSLHHWSIFERHPAYRFHPSTSVNEPASHPRSVDLAPQQRNQYSFTSGQNTPPASTFRGVTSTSPSLSPPYRGIEARMLSNATNFPDNAARPGTFNNRVHASPSLSEQQSHATVQSFYSPASHSGDEGQMYPTSSRSTRVMGPNALDAMSGDAAQSFAPSETIGNESTGGPWPSRQSRTQLPYSSASVSTRNSYTNPTSSLTSPSSSATSSSPFRNEKNQ